LWNLLRHIRFGNKTRMEATRKIVWDGLIPVVVNLSANEVTTYQPPLPLYTTIPRNSYLLLACGGPIKEHFMLSAPTVVDEMWFDFNGIPLKWHYPVGVLYDLLAREPDLPCPLTVHFQEFPATSLLRGGSDEGVRSHITNTLKEANFIKHGDATKFNSLSVTDSDALWNGICTSDFDIFWGSNKLLATNTMKHVPIRVVQDNLPFIQDLVSPKDDEGNERTLGSVLSQLLPQISFVPSSQSESPSVSTSQHTQPLLVVLLQGIEPPLESTIVWLYDRFSHPDNFMYLVVHARNNVL